MNPQMKKERTFWHEVGHFVAQELNKKYFTGCGNLEIRISKRIVQNEADFEGEAKKNLPEDYVERNAIKDYPAPVIASLVYGCIFQSAFLNQNLDACLNHRSMGVVGYHDFQAINKHKTFFFLTPDENKKLDQCIQDHFLVVKETLEQSKFFEIAIGDIIDSDSDEIIIPGDILRGLFSDFIAHHEIKYLPFVEEIKKIFVNHNGYKPKIR